MLQVAAMLLVTATIPINFHAGLWATMLLALVTLVKLIASRQWGNPALSRPIRLLFYSLLAYWLCFVVSFLFDSTSDTGREYLILKSILIVYPCCFLLSDTRFLQPKHLRWMGWVLCAACVGMFLWNVGAAAIQMAKGSLRLDMVVSGDFDSRHHAYVSLYVDVALFFIYTRLRYWSKLPKWQRWLLVVSLTLLVLYVLLVNSRAGLLVLWVLLALCTVYELVRKNRRVLLWSVIFAGYIVGLGAVLPGHQDRITQTVTNVMEDKGDARLDINQSSLQLAEEDLLLGSGVGNYREDLVDQYAKDGFESGVKARYNAHNQYIESILAVGIFNLIILVAVIAGPMIVAFIRKSRTRYAQVAIALVFAINFLFESMLERQMGLQFVSWILALMALTLSVEENKFGHIRKS